MYCKLAILIKVGENSNPTTQNLDCEEGEKCVLKRSTCSYPPCSKYPVCVAIDNNSTEEIIRTRTGTCPEIVTPGPCMEQCQNDGDCRHSEKCCFNGCGNTCRSVVTVIARKPGSCPWDLRRQPLCGMDCSSDSHCPGSEKCCLTACGSTCSRPCYHWLQRGSYEGVGNAIWSLPYQCRPAF
ncbi:Hypothetical predicted protein [Mytilus galloprovincialis]|uniref:WAP domain-containing protein n=1 Tax=Mytilus galloprovincialis TaxID=29158 RepID=A0A8B6HRB4_MYTGA|nr:Hypothetical predicted protein [Mytilus galloprovincialis]